MATSRTLWLLALNTVALVCLLTGIYYAVQFHRKPVLAWSVPLHLSHQELGTVRHSWRLAHYDASLWNYAVQICGGAIAAVTVVAFQRYRNDGRLGAAQWATQPISSFVPGLRRPPPTTPATSSIWNNFGLNLSGKMGFSTILVCMSIGAGVFSSLLGMHPATWTTTAPIGAVSTADITAELTRVPAATPWDMSSIMLRSAFERATSQKNHGREVTHSYIRRHLQDGEGVRVGQTVYPSIRTHGVGVAPAPWERKGYRVPADQGRVLAYAPIVAATNVTVHCADHTSDWGWGHEVHSFPSTEEPTQPNTTVHRFHVYPKTTWHTRGTNHTLTYIEGTSTTLDLSTWLALKKEGDEPHHSNNPEVHQLFLLTNVHPITHVPTIMLIDCLYGGRDVIRQVTMTSPLDPVTISDIIDTKGPLDFEDLYPATSAIETALGREGGAMVAGLAAAGITSLEVWDFLKFGGARKLELHELFAEVLVDTAQAYFSLVRQWREEAQFFSWPREVSPGYLIASTRRIGWDGGGGFGAVGGVVVLGLLALLPVSALWNLSKEYKRGRFNERFELRDGVIKRKED